MLTKNSQHLLSKCLTSIYQNLPIKNLIIIDGFSTDRTLEIIEKFNRKYGNVLLCQIEGSRAKARTEGIRKVSTEWFMFVDSDVLLCRDWFKKIKADLADGVGAVWGLNVDVLPNVSNKWFLKFQSMVAKRCFKLRGGMHDTLILRKAVEGIYRFLKNSRPMKTPISYAGLKITATRYQSAVTFTVCIISLLKIGTLKTASNRASWICSVDWCIRMCLRM